MKLDVTIEGTRRCLAARAGTDADALVSCL